MADSKQFGYMRVSTKGQNEDRQFNDLLAFGIHERDIHLDKQTGTNFNRKSYLMLRDQLLRKGDLLVITSIDRFGRNYAEILEEWRHITKVVGADILVLDMPILDTRNKSVNDLTSSLVNDIVIQLLSYAADIQVRNSKAAQRKGIDNALEKGVRFGRPPKEYPKGWAESFSQWKAGEITAKNAYTQLGLSKTTFYVLVKRYQGEGASG